MRFKIDIPTQKTQVGLEATVEASSWFEALQLALREVGRDEKLLDGAQIDLQRDGRIKVTDPKNGDQYELQSLSAPSAAKPKTDPSPEIHQRATIPGRQPIERNITKRLKKQSLPPTEETNSIPENIESEETIPIRPASMPNQEESAAPEQTETAEQDGKPSIIVNMPKSSPSEQAEPLPILVLDHHALADKGPQTDTQLGVAPPASEPDPPRTTKKTTDKNTRTQPFARMDHPTMVTEESAAADPEPLSIVDSTTSPATDPRFTDLKTGRNLEIVAGSMLRAIRTRVDADAGVVLVPDGKQRHVIIAAAFGLPKTFKARRFKFGDGVGGFSCEFDSALHVNDLSSRPDLLGELEEAFEQVSSVIASPVRARGRTYGAVELLRIEDKAFQQDEYFMLQDLCEAQAKSIGKKKK